MVEESINMLSWNDLHGCFELFNIKTLLKALPILPTLIPDKYRKSINLKYKSISST